MTDRKSYEIRMGTVREGKGLGWALLALVAVVVFLLWITYPRNAVDHCTANGGHYTTTVTGRDLICVDNEGRVIAP